MKSSRRRFLQLAAAAAALQTRPRLVSAQAYPSRPVHWIVGFPAGSTGDLMGHVMGQWLGQRLGQPFIVEDRPGAGGMIATESMVRSPPDGYTLLWTTPANAIGVSLYDKLSFNFVQDTAPVGGIMQIPQVMEVTPSFPARTVAEFIAYAKANPGKVNMASSGIGTGQHVVGELFKMMAGVDMVHVPYRGAPLALTDLMAGQVQVMFDVVSNSIPYIRSGQLRALAVTTATRISALPDIPTVADFIPGFEAGAWNGLSVPRNTPPAIINTLNEALNAALADPGIKARIVDLGGEILGGSPAAFGKFVADEVEKWAKVIKFAGLKAQ
jgi:tripartite-type tricarboxylate transporter receptor subunit TctC